MDNHFQEQCEAQRWAKLKGKHEAFLRGPEVTAHLDYCQEPRTVNEMLAFMQEKVTISKTRLVDRVVGPLLEEGTFERFKRQGKWKNIREYAYRVNKTKGGAYEKAPPLVLQKVRD